MYPEANIFGEWLVKHNIKYKPEAYNKFYVYDVYSRKINRFIPLPAVRQCFHNVDINIVIDVSFENPSIDVIDSWMKIGGHLCPEGESGEGIVLKNYDYQNRFGRLAFAKIVNNHFPARPKVKKVVLTTLEERIAEKFLTVELFNKTKAKIINDNGGWSDKYIPKLLGMIWHDVVVEETWQILKEHKNPVIDFKALRKACEERTKTMLFDV
jgi:hypothetical protein